jgi:hypothetical protein
MTGLLAAQQDMCRRFAAAFLPTSPEALLGVALETVSPGVSLHGMRHAPEAEYCGWYIWAGDSSTDPDFFKPLQVDQLAGMVPQVLPYLGLGPGWRFLLAPGYEDVWHDPTLVGG